MRLRYAASLLAGAALPLLSGCGDTTGPTVSDPIGLWIGETGVVLDPGQTVTLTARIQVESGSPEAQAAGSAIVEPAAARWWTDNDAVLRMPNESRGTIEALAPGRATVWVQVGSLRDSANVTVLASGEEPSHRWKAVATYATGTCALDEYGYAYCWGDDFWGGRGSDAGRRQWTNAHRPVRVNTSIAFEEIGRGVGHACARTAAGDVWCWGLHNGSHLAHGRTTSYYETGPVRVEFPGTATALGVGGMHACLLDERNRAHCWGNNMSFQLGVAEDVQSSADLGGRTLPVAFDGSFDALAVGDYVSCGITPDRDLYCWGRTHGGSTTMGELTRLPSRIDTPEPARMVSPGGGGCFLTNPGQTYCWGLMRQNPTGYYQLPEAALIDQRFELLAGGCGLDRGGTAWCWGSNTFHHFDPAAATEPCGLPSTDLCSPTPIAVTASHRFQSLSTSEAACGITGEGELYCWGVNERGQLGIGRPDLAHTHIPQRVLDPL